MTQSRSHTPSKTHEEIEAYWTPERRARARPREVEPPPSTPSALPLPGVEGQRDAPSFDPRPPAGASEGRKQDHEKADATLRPPVPVSDPDSFPWRTIGKLFFTSDGQDWVGSASVIAREGLLTVAHNLYNIPTRSWSANLWFYPAYDSGGSAYGAFSCREFWVTDEYVHGDRDYDVGLMRMNEHGGHPIGAIVGHLGYSINRQPERSWIAVGYPGAYHEGQRMMAEEGHFTRMIDNNMAVGMQGVLAHGTSGGPWLLFGDLAVVNGVHTFGRRLEYPDEVFSPYFGSWVGDFIQRHFR